MELFRVAPGILYYCCRTHLELMWPEIFMAPIGFQAPLQLIRHSRRDARPATCACLAERVGVAVKNRRAWGGLYRQEHSPNPLRSRSNGRLVYKRDPAGHF